MLRSYLWEGQLIHVRARVAWVDCCTKLNYGGLGPIDPETATRSLIVKWVTKAFDGGTTNLCIPIKFRL